MSLEPQPIQSTRVVLVVGIDFTDASGYALRLAENLVRPAGAEAALHIVHVAAPMHWTVSHGDVPVFLPKDAEDRSRRRLLDECWSCGKETLASIVPHMRTGDPTREIAEVAREVHADLIVLGAHKRNGLARALHRSTYARLVRHAPCSVLTALPKEEGDEPQLEPPCRECVAARERSSGVIQWCPQHSERHVHGHLHHASRDPNASGSWTFRL